MKTAGQGIIKDIMRYVWEFIYRLAIFSLYPVNNALSNICKDKFNKQTVLHISYMVHIPYYMVNTLRKFGMKADYMAIGESPVWDKCDYKVVYSRWPHIRALQEFLYFWKIVARYEIIHSHFMSMLSKSGWELPFLKKMGRKIVIHYRGCEIRDRKKTMQMNPEVNICQECDYNGHACIHKAIVERREIAAKYGDLFLVTTPDMKDFVPDAIHLSLFVPEIDVDSLKHGWNHSEFGDEVKIVHVTNHPGIEGTEHIRRAIDNLQRKGYKLKFVFLKGVGHDDVLREYASADLAIGKMKMGYYANAQIESMLMGVPTITHVREEFLTEDLKNSGFIFAQLETLEETIEYYMKNPVKLDEKRKRAKASIVYLHDNKILAERLIGYYHSLKKKHSALELATAPCNICPDSSIIK